MSTHSKSDPPSPKASVNSFETCSTLNAIASLDPSRLSSESNPVVAPSPRNEIGEEQTAVPDAKEAEVEESGNKRAEEPAERPVDDNEHDSNSLGSTSLHSSQDSIQSTAVPLAPNSPSNSNEPIRNAAASFGRRSSVTGPADESNSIRRRSRSNSIQSDLKGSSTGHPSDSTGQTYRDDDDGGSIKSEVEHKDSLPLPAVAAQYPPRKTHAPESDFAPPDGGIRAYLNVIGGFLVLFATFGYTNAWGVYQAYYSQTIYRTYSDSAIAWIGSIQLCLFFLMALVAGPLFDKGKFRYLLAAGSAVQTLSIFLIPQCGEFWQTMVVQGVMSGIGIGLSFLPALSIQSHWFERRRAFAIGIVTCGSSIGGIAFPIMLNKLFANRQVGFTDGVRASGYVVAGCLLIANLIMAPHPARLRANKPPLPPLRKIMTPTFACMTGGAFLLNWGLWMPLFYLQLFAQSKGVSSDLSFYTLAIYNAGSVFGRTIPNLAADYLGPQNIQSFSCVSAGIALYCMYACESAASIVSFAAIYGFLSGAFISLVSPAIISISDDISEIGLRQGVAFLIVAGGAVGGNPVCGKLLGLGGRSRTDPFLAPIVFAEVVEAVKATPVVYDGGTSRHTVSDLVRHVGYDTELFVKVEDWAICDICHEVLERPTMSGCAGEHMFCLACISQTPSTFGCPTCRGVSNDGGRKESVFASRLIQNFAVKCDYSASGCVWTGPLSNCIGHKNSCDFKTRLCSKANEGCDFQGAAVQLAEHARSTCPFEFVACPRSCGVAYKRLDQAKHEGICNAWPCRATEGCKTKSTLKFLKQHEGRCRVQTARLKKTKAKLSNVKSELRRKRRIETRKAAKEAGAGTAAEDTVNKSRASRLLIPTQRTASKAPQEEFEEGATANGAEASEGEEGPKQGKLEGTAGSSRVKKRTRGKKGKGKAKAKENDAPAESEIASSAKPTAA